MRGLPAAISAFAGVNTGTHGLSTGVSASLCHHSCHACSNSTKCFRCRTTLPGRSKLNVGPCARGTRLRDPKQRTSGLMEIANALHFPKATASRVCARGLESRQWLTRHEGDRSFAPGPRLLSLAVKSLAMRSAPGFCAMRFCPSWCRPWVRPATSRFLMEPVYVIWTVWRRTGPCACSWRSAPSYPLHATASGKLSLAHMADQRRQAVLENLLLAPCTSRTLQSAEALSNRSSRFKRLAMPATVKSSCWE